MSEDLGYHDLSPCSFSFGQHQSEQLAVDVVLESTVHHVEEGKEQPAVTERRSFSLPPWRFFLLMIPIHFSAYQTEGPSRLSPDVLCCRWAWIGVQWNPKLERGAAPQDKSSCVFIISMLVEKWVCEWGATITTTESPLFSSPHARVSLKRLPLGVGTGGAGPRAKTTEREKEGEGKGMERRRWLAVGLHHGVVVQRATASPRTNKARRSCCHLGIKREKT